MFSKKDFLFFFLIFVLLFEGCAKKGRPSGGPKDEDPPLLVIANPPYETTNFTAKEIKIEFNEFITLKDLNKQLVVSPPLKNNAIITPQGTPSKYLTIKLLDTLLENSTYIFDFGKSVQDNNEGNQLEKFKYVFSTGTYIDSLKVKGSVSDALNSETNKNIKLLLYRADSTYNDSLIYKQKPNYVSSTLDTTRFEFTNLAPGKFYLFALEDKNSDYFFDPKQDKIGIYPQVVSLPNDSILEKPIKIFKEILPYEFSRGKEIVKGKIILSYKGKPDSLEVTPLSVTPENFKSIAKYEKGKDTLNYWFQNYDKDSIVLLVKNQLQIDTAIVKLRKKQLDSLIFTSVAKGHLEMNDTLKFSSNNPIISLDTSKIIFTDKDTLKVKMNAIISKKENNVIFLFTKELNQKYRIKLLPNAVTDIFGFTNDTIQVNLRTKKLEEYGDLVLNFTNPDNKNLIVQLLTERNVFVAEKKLNSSETITFKYLRSQKLKVRVIHDANNNGKWDTGDFLKRIKPENVLYFDKEIEIRPNWSINESLTIKPDF